MLYWSMAFVRVQTTLQRDSGLASDVATNTWHFEDDDEDFGTAPGGTENLPGLASRLTTFYQAISSYLSVHHTGQGVHRMYDPNQPKPRAPIAEFPFTFSPATSGLPSEVALCLSFQAQRVSGTIAARRRGRVFLGPLSGAVNGNTTGPDVGDQRPQDGVITAILAAAKTMSTGGPGTYRLAVYSPTVFAQTQSLSDAFTDVTDIWMDNAFDTIRSRGLKRNRRFRVLVAGSAAPAAF